MEKYIFILIHAILLTLLSSIGVTWINRYKKSNLLIRIILMSIYTIGVVLGILCNYFA